MTVDEWLKTSASKLETAEIGTARLDCLVLLEDQLGKDRSYLLSHPETPLQGVSLKGLNNKLKHRVRHEPLAYIRGKTEFYGREFYVDKRVLEPRPESEAIIELLLELAKSQKPIAKSQIIDIGTGSGVLAITAKLEIPKTEVIATDIDPKCLAVARQNAKNYSAKIKFRQGDLLEPLRLGTSDLGLATTIVLANLPYVPTRYKINRSARLEPKIAIFGGNDGLDIYRRLFECLAASHTKPRFVLTEALPTQHQSLSAVAETAGFAPRRTNGFVQVFEPVRNAES